MELREQKYVCTLAECGNLTRASERLFISQPALSVYITNLEKSIGVPLFDRSGKRFTLTYAGERYVEKARQMLLMEQAFREEICAVVQETAGRLRLGVSQRRGAWLIPEVIVKYGEQWPEIDLVIREGNITDLNEMLKNNELDILILNKEDVSVDMEAQPLFTEEFLMAVPVRHPINEKAEYVPGARYRKIKPEHLNEQTLILHTPLQSSRGLEDLILKKNHVHPKKVWTIRSIETAVQMAAEGIGISFVREGYAVHLKYKKPVNYYMIDMEGHAGEVVAAYRTTEMLPAYVEGMVKILKEQGEHFLDSSF